MGALQLFSKMAALGIEAAQANAGLLLSRVHCPPWQRYKPLPTPITTNTASTTSASLAYLDAAVNTERDNWLNGKSSQLVEYQQVNKTDCEARALSFYLQSAYQGNGHAFLRVGDFYYYGKAGLYRDKRQAAVYYQLAADYKQTHALFNLGLMYETGDGVKQDFHLAKRFFDQAAAYDDNAILPSQIALFMLQSHQYLQGILGPDISSRYLYTLMYSMESIRMENYFSSFPTVSQIFHSTTFSVLSFVKPYIHTCREKVEKLLGDSNKELLLSSTLSSDMLLILAALVAYMYLHGWRRTRHQQRELERLRRERPVVPVIRRTPQPQPQVGDAADVVQEVKEAEEDHGVNREQIDVSETQAQTQSQEDAEEYKD